MVEAAGPVESRERLRVQAGDHERDAVPYRRIVKIVEDPHPRRVDGGHVAHPEDEDLRAARHEREDVFQLLRRGEEERSVDLVDLDAGRDGATGDPTRIS